MAVTHDENDAAIDQKFEDPIVALDIQNLIMIGSSIGGPMILQKIFWGMPRLNAGIVLIQHMPAFVLPMLVKFLDESTAMDIQIAEQGAAIEKGKVYVAPCDRHLKLIGNRIVHLVQGEKVHYVCPSVDVAMLSLEFQLNFRLVGVLLTGMGSDGAEGIAHIKRLKGVTIAQDKDSCAVFGMPKEAISTGYVDYVLPPSGIQSKLIELVGVVDP